MNIGHHFAVCSVNKSKQLKQKTKKLKLKLKSYGVKVGGNRTATRESSKQLKQLVGARLQEVGIFDWIWCSLLMEMELKCIEHVSVWSN